MAPARLPFHPRRRNRECLMTTWRYVNALVSAELCWNDDYNCAIVSYLPWCSSTWRGFSNGGQYISARLQNISRAGGHVYRAETRRHISSFIRFSAFPPAVKYPLWLRPRKRVVIFSGASRAQSQRRVRVAIIAKIKNPWKLNWKEKTRNSVFFFLFLLIL